MAKKDLRKALNLLIEEDCPKARDNERHKLRYRLDRLPEAELRELEYEHARYTRRFRDKLIEE